MYKKNLNNNKTRYAEIITGISLIITLVAFAIAFIKPAVADTGKDSAKDRDYGLLSSCSFYPWSSCGTDNGEAFFWDSFWNSWYLRSRTLSYGVIVSLNF